MDDMAGKISELLSDPEGMEKIKAMASALFSNNDDSDTKPSQKSSEMAGGLSLPDGFDPIKLMSVFSALKNGESDQRSTLLMALKPHLSPERQERVDKAVKLLKLVSVLPLLKQQGIFDELL